jgi:hypothetical protein
LFLCIGSLQIARGADKNHHKKKVQSQLPALPHGPTGPIQPIPLDSIAPVAPHVTYENGQLTIVAANSTLRDILQAVHEQTGAQIEGADANERAVTNLGPGPAQKIVAELLNGSGFNYVLLGSSQDPTLLARVVLAARNTETANTGAPPLDAGEIRADPNLTAARNARSRSNGEAQGQPDQPATGLQPDSQTPQLAVQEIPESGQQLQQQQFRGQPPISESDFPAAPEIDTSTGFAALALVTGTILIIRGRRGR